MDKTSTNYFMTKMTQEEFNEIRKDHKIVPYMFNQIRVVKKRFEDARHCHVPRQRVSLEGKMLSIQGIPE